MDLKVLNKKIIVGILILIAVLYIQNPSKAKDEKIQISESVAEETESKKSEGFNKFNNAPRIGSDINGLKKVQITFRDYNKIDKGTIIIYKVDMNNLNSQEIINFNKEQITNTENKEYKYDIEISKYLKDKQNQFHAVVTDKTGMYLDTYFRINQNKKAYYIDAAPRINTWRYENGKVSFIVKDNNGVNIIKIYDMNDNESLKAQKEGLKDKETKITINLSELKIDSNGQYKLKIYAQDNNEEYKQSAKRTIQFSINDSKEPVKEEPVKEEPVKEEPVKEEPVKEEPVKEEPVKEEPVKEEPVKEEPTKEEPAQEGKLKMDLKNEASNIFIVAGESKTIKNVIQTVKLGETKLTKSKFSKSISFETNNDNIKLIQDTKNMNNITITGEKSGTSIVTVKVEYDGQKVEEKFKVTINDSLKLSLNKTTLELITNNEGEITPTVKEGNKTVDLKDVTIKVNKKEVKEEKIKINKKIAAQVKNGKILITALKPGKTNVGVTIEYEGQTVKQYCAVTIDNKLTLELKNSNMTLNVGENASIKPRVSPKAKTTITYELVDKTKNIVTVDKNGGIKAKNPGTTEIKIKASFKNRNSTAQEEEVTLNVTVKEKENLDIHQENGEYYCFNGKNKVIGNSKNPFITKDGKQYYFSLSDVKYTTIKHRDIDSSTDGKMDGIVVSAHKYEQRVGWVKVGNDYYFFNTKYGLDGYMEKGKTIDGIELDKDGKAKISSNANAYVNRKLMILVRASDIVSAITKPSDTKEAKLKKCWDYMAIPYSSYSTPIPYPTNTTEAPDDAEAKFFDIEMAIYPLFSKEESIKSWVNGSSVLNSNETKRIITIDGEGRRCDQGGVTEKNVEGGEVGDCFARSSGFAYLANAAGYDDAKVIAHNNSHCWAKIGNKVYDVVGGGSFEAIYGVTSATRGYNGLNCWVKEVDTNRLYKEKQ